MSETFQFRGVYIPADVFRAYIDGVISSKELILLTIIDSLVESGGAGCFASKSYLARSIKVSNRWIQRMISKLIKIGLIIPKPHPRYGRTLEVPWSRVELVNKRTGRTARPPGGEAAQASPIFNSISNSKEANCRPNASRSGDKSKCRKQNPPNSEVSTMPFNLPIPDLKLNSAKLIANESDHNMASALADMLKERLVPLRRMSLSAWAKEFAYLRRAGVSNQRLAQVLDWYLANFRKPYVPLAFSGRGFRDKFPHIEEAMARAQRAALKDPDQIEVSEEARSIAAKISHLGWPKGSAAQLPATAQITLQNIRLSLDRLNSIKGKIDVMQTYRLGAIKSAIVSPSYFTLKYLQYLNNMVQNWPKFKGNLLSLAWRPDSKMSREYLLSLCKSSVSANWLNNLIKEISDEN